MDCVFAERRPQEYVLIRLQITLNEKNTSEKLIRPNLGHCLQLILSESRGRTRDPLLSTHRKCHSHDGMTEAKSRLTFVSLRHQLWPPTGPSHNPPSPHPAHPSSTMATRASTRVRTRSAKAVEAEATENLLAAAKAKQNSGAAADSEQQQTEEGPEGQAGDGQTDATQDGKPEAEDAGTRKSTRRRGKKTYCVCQKEARGEMIQCEGCKDW